MNNNRKTNHDAGIESYFILSHETIDFDFDDQPRIKIIMGNILQEYKLIAKINELDLKLVEAGLDECSEYTEKEYTQKMIELQNHS